MALPAVLVNAPLPPWVQESCKELRCHPDARMLRCYQKCNKHYIAEPITATSIPPCLFGVCGARHRRYSREMRAVSARAREVTVRPCASSALAAFAMRISSAARRASASGTPSAVSWSRLVISVVTGRSRISPAQSVTTTRPSWRKGRLRWAHSGQFGAHERIRHKLHP